MGLAASQARLLTITSRKSDCEFQSMRYSHQKIALSRNMTDISNEYQNALNKTKLVYDFYGNGDQTNPVTYGLLMSPSELNGYMPMLTTTSEGRVVLNSTYAAAARAAGIPQEGLGCLPSTTMRNAFYDAMVDNGIMSPSQAELCKSVMYSQSIGMGTTDLIATTIETKTVEEFLDAAGENVLIDFGIDIGYTPDDGDVTTGYQCTNGSQVINSGVTLTDIWNGNYVIHTVNMPNHSQDQRLAALHGMDTLMNWSGWEAMFSAIDNSLDKTDPLVKMAISIARNKINDILYGSTDADNKRYESTQSRDPEGGEGFKVNDTNTLDTVQKLINGFGAWEEDNTIASKYDVLDAQGVQNKLKNDASNYIGYYGYRVNMQFASYYDTSFGGGINTNNLNDWSGSGLAIDVSNILKTYLTTLYTELGNDNVSRFKIDDSPGVQVSEIDDWGGTGIAVNTRIITDGTKRSAQKSNFISDNCTFETVVDTGLNTEGSLSSGHYDAMFNQIAARGWVENNNINDKEYLREMYQNGLMFLTTCSDDGYYYQGDYSINSFIKEVADEDAIAKAEAKYNTEKQKLNHKEEIIDLKMRNLDTEISALTTEYDTIKSVISKNIERGFKRYDA